jgi:hypothetical protein
MEVMKSLKISQCRPGANMVSTAWRLSIGTSTKATARRRFFRRTASGPALKSGPMDSRVVKPQTPLRVIVTAVLIALLVFVFIILAVWQSGRGITEARMRGTVASKEFTPASERQITLGRSGELSTRDKEGDFILKVEVPQGDGTTKTFTVWLNKAQYEAVKVGDSFDVGPYVVK